MEQRRDSESKSPSDKNEINDFTKHSWKIADSTLRQYDQQRCPMSLDKNPHRETGWCSVEGKLLYINDQIEKCRNVLSELPLPERKCFCRDLTPEEKETVQIIEEFDKKIWDETDIRVISYNERMRTINFCSQAMKINCSFSVNGKRFSIDEFSAEELKNCKEACDKVKIIYHEISAPVWEELERMQDDKNIIRDKLVTLRRQRMRIIDAIYDEVPKHLPFFKRLKQYLIGSEPRNERSEMQEMLSAVKALIEKAREHKKALKEEIRMGHDHIFRKLIELRANTHSVFLPQQMDEYNLEEGKKVLVNGSCGPSSTTMQASDLDPTSNIEELKEKVRKAYEIHLQEGTFDGSTYFDDNVDVLNKVQDVILFKDYSRMKKSHLCNSLKFFYEGKRVAAHVAIRGRDSAPNHGLVIDDIKCEEKNKPVYIRDSFEHMTYRLKRFDYLTEVWLNTAIVPVGFRDPNKKGKKL